MTAAIYSRTVTGSDVRVLDCFTFHDEWEMLHARYVELEGLVEHVLCEADRTHQGEVKACMADGMARLADPPPNLTVLCVPLPAVADPWERERMQREGLWQVVESAAPDDLIVLSDVDEIPSRSAIERAIADPDVYVCEQRFYCNAIDWQHPNLWYGTAIAPRRILRNMQMLRTRDELSARIIEDGGWHFSWCGGPDRFRRKLRAFAHADYQDEWAARAEECWRDGIAVDGAHLIPVEVDDSYPLAVRRGDLDHLRRPRAGVAL